METFQTIFATLCTFRLSSSLNILNYFSVRLLILPFSWRKFALCVNSFKLCLHVIDSWRYGTRENSNIMFYGITTIKKTNLLDAFYCISNIATENSGSRKMAILAGYQLLIGHMMLLIFFWIFVFVPYGLGPLTYASSELTSETVNWVAWLDSLDGGSAYYKASTYSGQLIDIEKV